MKKVHRTAFFLSIFAGLVLAQDEPEKSMEGSFGTVTIDRKLWNQFAFRPVIPMGEFGVALDIVLYMDSDGNIHRDEWDFSSLSAFKNTIIDKIYYIRYGSPVDPLYVRVGSLDHVTLGYGILVADYSNTIQYPQVRKVGLEYKAKSDRYGITGFVNDFKENVGLFGARVTTSVPGYFEIGVSLVADRNQYLGLKDRDDDGRPDLVDDFPDDKSQYLDSDGDGIRDSEDLDIDGDGITDTLNASSGWSGVPYVLDKDIRAKSEPINVKDNSDAIVGAAVDVAYPVLDSENVSVAVYAEIAKLIGKTKDPSDSTEVDLGVGIVPVGFVTRYGPVRLNLEYRIIPGDGRFDFWYWDLSYEVERATFSQNSLGRMTIQTKESKLGTFGKQRGFYGKFGVNLGSLVSLVTEYQNLTGQIWEPDLDQFEERQNQSLKATVLLRQGFSRLKGASLFYYQRNVENPFEFMASESTVMGYRVSIELAGGLTLNYVNRRTFSDVNGDGDVSDKGESINITTIETSFSF
ncbi:MAG: thrombospondin type 3 repeat-containing protein [Candidatus Neomarinimicrobiota bacterium]